MATTKTSAYAPVNGLNLFYEIHGKGKPIVLLHGSYNTIELNWSAVIPVLAKKRKVIAIEMQGHGRTADIDRPITYEAMADDVAGLLNYLKIGQADVLGYSFGGTVALQVGIQHPRLVNRLVLMSTVYSYEGWSPEVRKALQTITPELFEKTPLKTEYERVAPDPDYWPAFVRKLARFDAQNFTLGEANLKKLKAPVLFIMGDNDGVTLAHKADLYRLCGGDVFGDIAGLPASQLAILPGTTHVSLMQQPDRFLPMIQAFLDRSGNTPATAHSEAPA